MKNRILPYVLIALPVLGSGTIQTFILGERTGTTTISVIVIVLGIYFYYSEKRLHRNNSNKMKLLLPLLIYVTVFALNVAFIGRGFNGDHDTRRWIVEIVQPLIMYLIATRICLRDGDTKIRNLLISLLFIESLLSIVGIISSDSIRSIADMSASGESITRDYETAGTGNPGSIVVFGAGTFDHSNILGAFLILLLPQLIFRWIQIRKKDFHQIFLLGTIVIAILLTFSRSTWLGFFLTILLTVFTGEGGKKIWSIIFAGTIIFFVIYFTPLLQTRLMDVATIDVRSNLRDIGIDMFLQSPWFGYGVGFFASLTGDSLLFNPHNDYVTRLLGGGVVGFIAFIFPFVTILTVSSHSWFSTFDKNLRMKSSMAFITCFVYIVLMTFNPIQELFFLVPITFAIYEVNDYRYFTRLSASSKN